MTAVAPGIIDLSSTQEWWPSAKKPWRLKIYQPERFPYFTRKEYAAPDLL
jgi:hypothetical protein